MAGTLIDLQNRIVEVEKCRDHFTNQGIEQKQFCEEKGIDRAMLSRWLSGKVIPKWESIERLKSGLGIE